MKASFGRDDINWHSLLFGTAAVLAGLGIGLIANTDSLLIVLALAAGLLVALAVVLNVEWGLFVLIFISYTRFSDVLTEHHGAPSVFQPFLGLVIVMILVRWLVFRRRPLGWEKTALLVILYGLVLTASLLNASDFQRAQEAATTFIKDAVIVIIIGMILQRRTVLRQVTYSLLLAGIFMGSITTFQYLTQTFGNNYWGFGLARIQNIVTGVNENRISGPIGDPNFYGQFLIVLVPLAIHCVIFEKKRWLRLLAAWSLVVCVLSIIFTFSRGAALGLALVIGLMLLHYRPKPVALLLLIILGVLALRAAPEKYLNRLLTIKDIIPGFNDNLTAEVSFGGRASEALVAYYMFRDHPLLGVGLNNYNSHYQQYSRYLGLDPRREARSAHSLYLEILAETGLVGLLAFGLLLLAMGRSLLTAHREFMRQGMNDFASLAYAYGVSMTGYLFTSIFLHLAYPRYFWLLFGIIMAIPQVARDRFAPTVLPIQGSRLARKKPLSPGAAN